MAGWGVRLGLLLHFASLAAAGHFHYASLSWRHVGGNNVEFLLVSTWSSDYGPYKKQGTGGAVTLGDVIRIQGLGNPVLEFGDGDFSIAKATVTAVNAAAGTWTGVSNLTHTYAAQNDAGNPWTAVFSGCCRRDGLVNNAEGAWRLYSTVDLARAQFSPRAAMLPLVTLRALSSVPTNAFYVAARDDGVHPTELASGVKLSYALTGTLTDWMPPPGFNLDPVTGLVSANVAVGVYSVAVEMTNIDTNAKAVVDFEVEVVPNSAIMPVFDTDYPASRLPTPAINTLYVGFAEQFTLRFLVPGAAPADPDGTLATGFTLQTTLLPGGASLSPITVNSWNIGAGAAKGYESTFSWTPVHEDEGWRIVCVTASGVGTRASLPFCLDFHVQNDPAPVWRLSITPGSLVATMGKQLFIPLETLDTNRFDAVRIAAVDAPEGAVLTPSASVEVPEGLVTSANFSWTPSERVGGLQGQLCFNATDDGSQGRVSDSPTDVCYSFSVPKCRYSVGPEESLVDIATRFGTSWLQLWALNKEITRPEGYGEAGGMMEGLEINVGQLVEVREGDSLEKIAARFGTTLRQMLGLNADITSANPIVRGQLVCVVPNSCSERAS